MIKKSAVFFSYLLHPLLMPTFGILIIFFTNTYLSTIPFEAKKMLIILVFIGTLLLPALMIPVFFIKGMVSDMGVKERRERIISSFYNPNLLYFKLPAF
jgi:type IV secretory pathway VirB6-like protein